MACTIQCLCTSTSILMDWQWQKLPARNMINVGLMWRSESPSNHFPNTCLCSVRSLPQGLIMIAIPTWADHNIGGMDKGQIRKDSMYPSVCTPFKISGLLKEPCEMFRSLEILASPELTASKPHSHSTRSCLFYVWRGCFLIFTQGGGYYRSGESRLPATSCHRLMSCCFLIHPHVPKYSLVIYSWIAMSFGFCPCTLPQV